jgi:hypothetical protein
MNGGESCIHGWVYHTDRPGGKLVIMQGVMAINGDCVSSSIT